MDVTSPSERMLKARKRPPLRGEWLDVFGVAAEIESGPRTVLTAIQQGPTPRLQDQRPRRYARASQLDDGLAERACGAGLGSGGDDQQEAGRVRRHGHCHDERRRATTKRRSLLCH